MAKGKKTGGRNFVKNDPRRMEGGAKLDPILKQLRELERPEFTVKFSEMLRMIKPEIQEVIQNPKTCIKDLGIAKAILKWLESGDFRYIQPYIEYIFGKPKENISVKGDLIVRFGSGDKLRSSAEAANIPSEPSEA